MMIKTLEERSMNAWPALQTIYDDGWVLRFAGGYTKRANSIYPLYESKRDLLEKIAQCETIYGSKGLDVVYKMTSSVSPPHLDAELAKLGYIADGFTSVQVLPLQQQHTRLSHSSSLDISEVVTQQWIDDFCRLNAVSEENKLTMLHMLKNIGPACYFVSLKQEESTVACGLGVVDGDFIGLFDIVTDQRFRRLGFGRRLVLELLHLGRKQGARFAYLQVVLDNSPALGLYSSLGFKEAYQYWYRIKKAVNINGSIDRGQPE